ncbi:hypothetical protein [Psychrobacter immobilis]|nr:hypothetical protein [Psychrobacter immobilis]
MIVTHSPGTNSKDKVVSGGELAASSLDYIFAVAANLPSFSA